MVFSVEWVNFGDTGGIRLSLKRVSEKTFSQVCERNPVNGE